ncbi:MAG: LnmK family bifunctional acyltransferase/decarboxylase [Pseudomonadota bacterium]
MTFSLRESSNVILGAQTLSQTTPIRLGMPHLGSDGLSIAWLMKEAGHIHWLAVAEALGTAPSQWFDADGRRCFASVVAATLSGSTVAFQEDTICQFRVVSRPSPETNWLSQIDLETATGERVCVELMTTFATLEGPSNMDLVRSKLSEGIAPPQTMARRAQILRDLGKLERKRAEGAGTPPHLSIPISEKEHLNGVGLVYFAQFQNFFATAEANAIPKMPRGCNLVTRRIHYYGNLDPSDTLDIMTEITTNVHNISAWLISFSHARRRSDGNVIATCESSYRV